MVRYTTVPVQVRGTTRFEHASEASREVSARAPKRADAPSTLGKSAARAPGARQIGGREGSGLSPGAWLGFEPSRDGCDGGFGYIAARANDSIGREYTDRKGRTGVEAQDELPF
jgi:hypothetical protein